MPKGYKPTIFVSSTCFDLGQVRAEIRNLIISLGLEPLLSEYDSFPISPDIDTVANCLQNVRERADIFILIIGPRYGFQTENGRSITNLEYIEAKKKGIPIYVFINQNITNILPIWKNNPNADFTSHVENPKVLEFVESVSDYKSNWIYKFNDAQHIKDALLQQIPYLFMESLIARQKLQSSKFKLPEQLYSANAAKLIIEKPYGWVYLLFGELCKFYLDSLSHKKFDLEYGICFSDVVTIHDPSQVFQWMSNHQSEMLKLIAIVSTLINNAADASFNEAHTSGCHQKIQHVSQRLLEAYENIINWKLSFKRLEVDEIFHPLLNELSSFADDPLYKIEKFINEQYDEVPKALDKIKETGESVELNLTFVLEAPDMEHYEKEAEILMFHLKH
ncbi:DUF4062 domain-containing protein [Parashewanella tropica]|uniref:DUF4062 domain-containing protein n=1 Tax=Parashewanella tropica TaxID=2547970 RepID=UPI00105A16A1|nr:DUF4062 domain-containing protein [Parashewanella tropica]